MRSISWREGSSSLGSSLAVLPSPRPYWRDLRLPLAAGALVSLTAALVWLPWLTITVLMAALSVGAVILHPPLGAYALLVATPLIVGIDRGVLLPLLRPSEALGLLVGAALLARGSIRLASTHRIALRTNRIDVTLAVVAVTSSVVPLLWMLARGRAVSIDDLLYALTLWKFFGIYLVFRCSIRTEAEVGRCLWLSLGCAFLVAVVAILQSLKLFGVPDLLATWYAPFADEQALEINRGTSTLASSIATGDVMAFNLAIAMGWLLRGGRPRPLLVAAIGVFVLGGLASGQFSGIIALVVALAAIGLLTGRLSRLALAVMPVALIAGLVMQPVVERRLSGFDSAQGLPPSWLGRLENLRTYFWPELFSDFNFLLGVRPAARVPAPELWRQYVWIESGHTWLLWNGGIPLFVAFFVFLWTSVKTTAQVARARTDAIGVAAMASFAALGVLAVLMTFDPHLTLRGSADLSFALLAMATTAGVGQRASSLLASPVECSDVVAGHRRLVLPAQPEGRALFLSLPPVVAVPGLGVDPVQDGSAHRGFRLSEHLEGSAEVAPSGEARGGHEQGGVNPEA